MRLSMDSDWSPDQFEAYLSADWAIGLMGQDWHVVGQVVDGDLFIEKLCLPEDEQEALAVLEELPYLRITARLSLAKQDHGMILLLSKLGFRAEADGEMQIAMTRSK
ncbi:MAG: hypothetical protein JO261_11505 [Alphaproteobacteria bacterium]|nr:hypothetical protein [Alphaproteobacteria bacterium]